jgi:hypothetical protein
MNSNMVITSRGKYSILSSSGWSSVQQAPLLNGNDLWSVSMGSMLISNLGFVSTYTASNNSWTTPIQLLPQFDFTDRNIWNVVLDDMVVSSAGEICKYSNGTFSKIPTLYFPEIAPDNVIWNGAMKLN